MNQACSSKNSSFNVRKVTVAEADSLCKILSEYNAEVGVGRPDTLDTILLMTSGQQGAAWIAWSGDTAAGCVTLRPLKGLAKACEIKRLFVAKPHRRKGLAKLLLDEVEVSARECELDAIYLDSRLDLVPALDLYRSLGYRACEAYHDNPEAQIFMVKRLGQPEFKLTGFQGDPDHDKDGHDPEHASGPECR